MKPWITFTLASCSLALGFASWLEATTAHQSLYHPYGDVAPLIIEENHSNSEPIDKAIHAAHQANQALQQIKVINRTPEQLRASFTNYSNAVVMIEFESLPLKDQTEIKNYLREAHLKRTQQLALEVEQLPATREAHFTATELTRGILATASQL